MILRQYAHCYSKVVILLVFLVLGCSRSTPAEDLLSETSKCDPPCWMDIYPGETTTDEVSSKLQSLEVQGKGKSYILEGDVVRWNASNNIITYIYMGKNGLVSKMRIDARGISANLDEVLAAFGEPSSLIVEKMDDGYFSVSMFYPIKGLVLVMSGSKTENKDLKVFYKIEPDMVLTLLYFLPPSDIDTMIFNLHGENAAPKLLLRIQDWKGTGDYGE